MMKKENEKKVTKEKSRDGQGTMWKWFLVLLILMLAGFSYLIFVLAKYLDSVFLLCLAGLMAGISFALWLLWRKWPKTGVIVQLIFIFLLLAGILIVGSLNHAADQIARTTEYEVVQIAVYADSNMKASDSLDAYQIGYNRSDQQAHSRGKEILQEQNRRVKEFVSYGDTKAMYSALKRDSIQLMVLTSDTRSDLSVIDENYEDKIRVLFEKKYPLEESAGKAVDISKEPFTVYLCGADLSAGQDITSTGRGDVNILLTVNPQTKDVYMQAIPRDTFVYIPCRNGSSKLSYSGWWGGVASSVASIEDKFGVEINYYAKINFNGFVDLIDELGGITVYSYYDFDYNGYHFVKGENQVDGKKALQFVRARKMLPQNELSRGLHQMELIKGIFKKFSENADYGNAVAVMEAVAENFTTNLPEKDFYQAYHLIRQILPQLMEMDIHSMEGEYQWHYDQIRKGYYQYYFYPYEEEIERVREEIQRIKDGA